MRKTILIVVAVLLLGYVYYAYDPSHSELFPKCPFRSLTGWLCPGCGSQRAVHQLLHGHVAAAFRYNALMVMAVPFVLVLLLAEWKRRRWPHFYASVNHPWVILAVALMAVAWWVGRNVIL